jgi:hypothetical protein
VSPSSAPCTVTAIRAPVSKVDRVFDFVRQMRPAVFNSNESLVTLKSAAIRSYVAEADRGRRDWSKEPEAQAPVYRKRRRIRGRRGHRLMRRRGELIERSFAHLYDTGGRATAISPRATGDPRPR